MGKVICNGIPINYHCVGEGRDVVLIHGLATSHAFWPLNVLMPLGRNYRLTLYDLRGHGYSGMPASGYTSADMAEDLDHLVNHLNISQADLIGHSFGGVVALHYASLYPQRVSSLTIADSRVCAFQPNHSPQEWPNRDYVLQKLEELGLTIPPDEAEAGLYFLELLASPEWQEAKKKLDGCTKFIPFAGWNGSQRGSERWLKLLHSTTARQDLFSPAGLTVAKLAGIQQRTLAIYGEHSAVMPSCHGLHRHLPNCRTFVVPGAGHFYPLTRPKLFFNTVNQFLREVSQSDRRKHPRIPLRVKVALQESSSRPVFSATTVNVSEQGLLIESSRALAVGFEIQVLAIMKPDGRKIALRGKVARKDEEKIGANRFAIELFTQGQGYHAWKDLIAA